MSFIKDCISFHYIQYIQVSPNYPNHKWVNINHTIMFYRDYIIQYLRYIYIYHNLSTTQYLTYLFQSAFPFSVLLYSSFTLKDPLKHYLNSKNKYFSMHSIIISSDHLSNPMVRIANVVCTLKYILLYNLSLLHWNYLI